MTALTVLIAGCDRVVTGAPTAHHVDTGLVDTVLPTVDEAGRVTGEPMKTADDDGDKPFHGGPDILFEGARDAHDIAPFECESMVSLFSSTTYARSSLVAAARVLYYSRHRGQNVFSADASSFRFASPEDARRMLAGLAEHWRHCSGASVHVADDQGAPAEVVTFSDVITTRTLVSEKIVRSPVNKPPQSRPMTGQRAMAVVADVIVDARVDMDPDYGPPAAVGDRAIDLARLMVRKIATRA